MKSETTESPDVRLQPVIGSEGVSVGDDAFSAGGGISDKGEGSGSGTESRPRPRLKLINWYGGREASALANELYGKEKGQHATPDEVRANRAFTSALIPPHLPRDTSPFSTLWHRPECKQFLPQGREQILSTAPPGVDLKQSLNAKVRSVKTALLVNEGLLNSALSHTCRLSIRKVGKAL